MTIYRADTSFPYLAIASLHGVPYGLVLAYADYLEKTHQAQITTPGYWEIKAATELPLAVQSAALSAWNAERLRRERLKT